MKNIIIAGFALMVIAQWYAPVSMILGAEETLDKGQEFKFRTRPVDPSDPFRGKYITLDYDAETYSPLDTVELYNVQGENMFAVIGTDSLGFAVVDMLTHDPPSYSNYITVLYDYRYENTVHLEFPFKRFYLEESKASDAEQLYWQSRGDSSVVCYAKVKVYKGNAKLIDVMLNDSSIVDVVRRINTGKPD